MRVHDIELETNMKLHNNTILNPMTEGLVEELQEVLVLQVQEELLLYQQW